MNRSTKNLVRWIGCIAIGVTVGLIVTSQPLSLLLSGGLAFAFMLITKD